ncbi:hypothetical protein NQ317_008747 [Molorchus minor]|uniref:Uncharacterized protein n=1 Tax=Molorchus minor TaxID=1323400 RepID=A0ABQ9IRS6_9CUCU|nr:hypothetical protein NQ317_008747 [Molorchus minor]
MCQSIKGSPTLYTIKKHVLKGTNYQGIEVVENGSKVEMIGDKKNKCLIVTSTYYQNLLHILIRFCNVFLFFTLNAYLYLRYFLIYSIYEQDVKK